MFSFLLKLRRRIKRLLKVQSETRQRPVSSVRSMVNKAIILVTTAVLIGVLYPGQSLYDPLNMPREGEVALEDVIAPFSITVMKTERELRDERDLAQAAVPYVIDADSSIVQGALTGLDKFVSLVDSVRRINPGDTAVSDNQVAIVASRYPMLSEAAVRQSLAHGDLPQVRQRLRQILMDDIYDVGVVSNQTTLPEMRNKSVLVRSGSRESIHPRDRLLPVAEANARLLSALNTLYSVDSTIDVEYHYLVGRTFIQPNLKPNESEYRQRVRRELDDISKVKEVVREGDIIVRSGNRLSERQERVLQEMAQIKREEATQSGGFENYLPVLARVFLSLCCLGALTLFLFLLRRDLFNSNPRYLALMMVFGLQLCLVYFASEQLGLSVYLFPVAALAVLVTILFDAQVGFLSNITLAALLGIMHRFDFTLVLITILVGTVAVVSSRVVRKRSDFFKIMFFVSLAYVVLVPLIETLRLTPRADIPMEMAYGVVNGIVVVFVTIGVLPFFESLFGITTDIRLLELSDLNHPLLKRLALEAPGTYHHSINVGNLTEAAAKAIGANSLLARVGTYYHDIGKIEIPEYFVENQLSIKSKHEELTPSMSALILSAHVKKGRLLGESADIPDDVLNFIEEHHGTMVQTYFYNKALEDGADDVDINKFRYPGPKPQIRETGIAMLADAVEAASRTLDEPKPARIDTLIKRIVDDRVQSGELDECPLTLHDLARIREAFAQVLIGAFHHRVRYPHQEELEEAE